MIETNPTARDFRPALGTARRRMAGVTLLELMVTVAVLGILSAVAYPSYLQYVTRTKRSAAKTILLEVADRQEQFFADNKSYAANLTQLGFPANAISVDDDGDVVPAGDAERIYAISLSNTSATTFTVNAVPEQQQARFDDQCLTLSLTHTGLRGHTGPGPNCW